MIKNIIFDFDGTIVDSIGYSLDLVNRLSADYKYKKLSDIELKNLRNKSVGKVIKAFKVPFYKIPFVLNRAKKVPLEDYLKKVKPFNQIKQVLIKLKKSHNLGILSSAPKDKIMAVVNKHNIDYFDYIKSDVSIIDKSREMKHLVKKMNLEKESTIYIGDEKKDIIAAKKAGIKVIAVTWGFNSESSLRKLNPDFIAKKPGDILKMVGV